MSPSVGSVARDGGGQARRRARSRAALIAAGQALLVGGRTDASIQEITELAGVGFGTFYNHFASKDELFADALESTLIAYGDLRDAAVAGLEDPAEVFAVSFRLTGRLAEGNPEMMRLMQHSGPAVLTSDHGLRPRALHDLAAARAAGRFDFEDLEVAFMASGSTLLGMLQLLAVDSSRDVAETTDIFVAATLRMLGFSAAAAREMVSRPLPAIESLNSLVTERAAAR